MSEPTSISSGIASRYATAVFQLAKENKKLKQLEADVDVLQRALNESPDLQSLISSPLYSRSEMENAIVAVAEAMKLQPYMSNTLALMASKRRLFVLPSLLGALRSRIAKEKGEVASAKALTKTQATKLAKTLKAQLGSDVKIQATVDETLIGGIVVKVGSKMIDTSIRSKLNALQNTMKEVG